MGLDFVELVMRIEERFGIAIPDEDASKVETAGDLHKLVLLKLRDVKTDRCLTSAAFYRVRRGFIEGLGISRREIAPSLDLETLLPKRGRRRKWQLLQRAAPVEIPDLQFPRSVLTFIAGIGTLLAGVLLGASLFNRKISSESLVVWGLIGIVIVMSILVKLCTPLAVAFPNQAVTVGDLARGALSRNYRQLAASIGGYNEADTWEALRGLIVDQIGVEKDKVTPEARIVKDLGVD